MLQPGWGLRGAAALEGLCPGPPLLSGDYSLGQRCCWSGAEPEVPSPMREGGGNNSRFMPRLYVRYMH